MFLIDIKLYCALDKSLIPLICQKYSVIIDELHEAKIDSHGCKSGRTL